MSTSIIVNTLTSALYEQNKIKHESEGLEELETEMMEWVPEESKESPNRIDALVWALFDLYKLSEKPKVPVYRADYRPHKHIAPTNLLPINKRPIYIGWGLGVLPAVVICQKMGNGQVRVLDELIAEEAGLRRFAITKVRKLLKKRYSKHKFVSVGSPAGVETQKGSDNERAAFDVLYECGIPTEPAYDQGFEALSDNVRRYMQLSNGKQAGMLIDPRCEQLTEALLSSYHFNDNNKPNELPICEAHQYALLEMSVGELEMNYPIMQQHVVHDEDIGY